VAVTIGLKPEASDVEPPGDVGLWMGDLGTSVLELLDVAGFAGDLFVYPSH
jgi:hypothetical protein